MSSVVRQALWDAELARSGCFDKIIVQNLEVTVNAGTDVWGRQKVQRALISVSVTLGHQFASASTTDTVDASTIHYGILSKAIQADVQSSKSEWASTHSLSAVIGQSVEKVAGSTPIFAVETNVCYVKGSMFGDGAGYTTSRIIQGADVQSHVLYLRNVRIPCLIGVNSNERLQKQPVVLNIWVERVHESQVDEYAKLETFLCTVCLCHCTAKLKLTSCSTSRHRNSRRLRVCWSGQSTC
jgi:dihydroneopterin aldolase